MVHTLSGSEAGWGCFFCLVSPPSIEKKSVAESGPPLEVSSNIQSSRFIGVSVTMGGKPVTGTGAWDVSLRDSAVGISAVDTYVVQLAAKEFKPPDSTFSTSMSTFFSTHISSSSTSSSKT